MKGRFQSFLQNVSSYTATIPSANDSEAQPKPEVSLKKRKSYNYFKEFFDKPDYGMLLRKKYKLSEQ